MSSSVSAVIADLKAQVQRMEGPAARWPMPTHPVLSSLLQLRSGGVYQVASPSLAMLLMAGPSSAGAWCAVVGIPQFGIEAARAIGVRTERVVYVPEVQTDELFNVVAALMEVVDVVVLAPTRVTPTQAARLVARMREKHCLLATWGAWPSADARLDWSHIEWRGVGLGHGNLQARRVTLEVHRGDRRTGAKRVWFPDVNLVVREDEQHSGSHTGEGAVVPRLRSVP